MARLGKKDNISFLIGLSIGWVGITIIVYFTVGRMVGNFSERVKKEFADKGIELRESQELVRSLPNPEKAIEDMERKIQEFNEMGLTKKQLPKLIQLLGETATEREIRVISMKPREDLKTISENLPAGVTKIYIEMIVSANYKKLGDFVKALGELPVSFNVDSLAMESRADPAAQADSKVGAKTVPKSVDLQATLLLSTYMIWEI